MYSARNRNAVIADDTFQIQDWLRSNGNHDRGYPEFDYHHRIRPLSPVKRQRISTTDGKGPDRRRQLKSMESLLGLSDENLNGKNLSSEAVTRASPDVQDSLDRALMDFEETLELAFQSNSIVPPPRGFSNHNLVEGDESNFNKLDSSFESYTTGSSGYSTKPEHSMHRSLNTYNELQLIREQMVKSLAIIKDLEEQVKMVPKLKAQVSSLNLEKQRLFSELEKLKKMENENKNASGVGGENWSRSSTLRSLPERPAAVTTKDVGVNCVPMCRDVGVTTPVAASTASASTMTERFEELQVTTAAAGSYTGRRAAPSVTAYTQTSAAAIKPATAAAHTQTAAPVKPTTAAVHTQTWTAAPVKPTTVAAHTQTAAVAVKPTTAAAYTQTAAAPVETAVATAPLVQPPTEVTSIAKPPTADVGTQSARPVRTATVGVMARPRTYDVCVTVKPALRHVGCSAVAGPPEEVAERPAPAVTRDTQTDVVPVENRIGPAVRPASVVGRTIGRRSNSFHQYTAKDSAAVPVINSASSKIPRLKPITPEFNRKVYTRQDTYTKTVAEICTATDRLPRVTDDDDDDDNVNGGGGGDNDDKSKESLSSTPEHQNGLPESEMNFKPIQDDAYKDNPSKEMKGALKVLHDSLKKTTATLLPRAQLKQAIDIVREEWFKVTSTSDSGSHLVKNYINWFTSYSPALLEFIINMTDAAGNTVLHYSISHGNFDVVSTILDTGVCNVNLTNDAGYSSVMLVSLAEIKNDDEMKVIKRLFKYGDVNLQAKKHGQTTLMLAVSHGKIEVVKLLLECGADLNMQDEDGSTALMCAAEHGLEEIINILLSYPECDVSIADNDGSTALSIAMEAGHREIGIALYAKQHILSRENSPFNLSKTKRSRSANTVMPSNGPYSNLSLKKSTSLQPREYATLSSMLKTRTP